MTKETRPQKAARKMADGIVEMVHLMYQKQTALSFIIALRDRLAEKVKEFINGEAR